MANTYRRWTGTDTLIMFEGDWPTAASISRGRFFLSGMRVNVLRLLILLNEMRSVVKAVGLKRLLRSVDAKRLPRSGCCFLGR